MNSILTNTAAIAALSVMRGITADLDKTREMASSGLRVQNAASNVSYWSIATSMRSDLSARASVNDALNLSLGIVDTAYTGMTAIIDLLNQTRDKIQLAIDAPPETRDKLEQDIIQLRDNMLTVAKSASFSGVNWLYRKSSTQPTSQDLVTGLVRGSDGSLTVTHQTIDLNQTLLIDESVRNPTQGMLTRSYTNTSGVTPAVYTRHAYVRNNGSGGFSVIAPAGQLPSSTRNTFMAEVRIIEGIIRDVVTTAASLGAARAGIEMQRNFSAKLYDIQQKSVGGLVDADMGEVSARTRALETREQLSVQALNIANARAQSILALFR